MSGKDVALTVARVVCYAALALVIAGAIALVAPFALGLCWNKSGGIIACSAPAYRQVYEFGFSVVLMAIFTGFPALLAIGGLVFSVIDVRRWWTAR